MELAINFDKYNKILDQSLIKKKGKIVNVVGLTLESAGPDAKLGDVCYIYPEAEGAKPILAEVVGFKEGKTQLMPYDVTDGIGLGNIVENTGETLKVWVGPELLGKCLDGLGRPTDGTRLSNIQAYPVEAPPPDPMSRVIINEVLPLGVKAVDGLITIGKGQRIGIFAGSCV